MKFKVRQECATSWYKLDSWRKHVNRPKNFRMLHQWDKNPKTGQHDHIGFAIGPIYFYYRYDKAGA
jgi:hypothetical protein